MGAPKQTRAQELIALARHENGEDRAELYRQIAELFQSTATRHSDMERELLVEIMRALSVQVDMRLRLALAERMADRGDANHDLIMLLAHDEIEVAAPVIARSVVLTEADLVGIIRECSPMHSVCIAARPLIGARVCEALVETHLGDVLRTLSCNESARIAPRTLEQLVELAQHDQNLASALANRTHLPQGLAMRLYGWASVALKKHIAARFDIDPALLEADIARSVSQQLSQRKRPENRAEMLTSLVEKMRDNGQLSAGFLVKAIREGQMDLFRIAFARLLNVNKSVSDRILDGPDLVQIAYAMRAAGIDKSAFTTIADKLYGPGATAKIAPEVRAKVEAALRVSPASRARERLMIA